MCHEILTLFKTCGHTVPFLETCPKYSTTSKTCMILSDPEELPPQDGFCFDCLQKQSDEEATQRDLARADGPKLYYKSRTTYRNCGHSDVAETEIERSEGDPEFLEEEHRGQCWDCAKIPQSELNEMRKLAELEKGTDGLIVHAGPSGQREKKRIEKEQLVRRVPFAGGTGNEIFPEFEDELEGRGRPRSPEFDESDRKGKGRAGSPPQQYTGSSKRPAPSPQAQGSTGSLYSSHGSASTDHSEHSGYDSDDYPPGDMRDRTQPPQAGGKSRIQPVEEYPSSDEESDHDLPDPRGPPNWGRGGGHPLDRPIPKQGAGHAQDEDEDGEPPAYSDDDGRGGRDIGDL